MEEGLRAEDLEILRYAVRLSQDSYAEDRGALLVDTEGIQLYAACTRAPALGQSLHAFVFRGSDETLDWLRNAMTCRAPLHVAGGEDAHCGFVASARTAFPVLAEAVREALSAAETQEGWTILITGHSAGGAQALLTALHLAHFYASTPRCAIVVVMIGAPRCVDRATKEALESSTVLRVFRIEDPRDPVVSLPPSCAGFVPVGRLLRPEELKVPTFAEIVSLDEGAVNTVAASAGGCCCCWPGSHAISSYRQLAGM